VRAADNIVAITGAGVSTASGIPDYRGPEGQWALDPKSELESDVSVLLGTAGVRERTWQSMLSSGVRTASPNAAHYALARLEQEHRLGLLLTQNVDGLHLAAGTSPERLIELHGAARTTRCFRCGREYPTGEVLERVAAGDDDPRCAMRLDGRECGGGLGLAVVHFGEYVNVADVRRAYEVLSTCDLLLCVGTSLAVNTVTGFVLEAMRRRVPLIIVNESPTSFDESATAVVRGNITDTLPSLLGY
jgi:NAD-dependent deacetylase